MKVIILTVGFLVSSSVFAGSAIPILKLEKREHIIWVKTEGARQIFTVESKSGQLLAKDLTESRLRTKYPKIYRFVKSALAQPLDARIDPKYLREKKH